VWALAICWPTAHHRLLTTGIRSRPREKYRTRAMCKGFAEWSGMSCHRAAVALIAACSLPAAARLSAVPDSIALLLPTGAIDAAAHGRLESGAPWVDTLPARDRDLAIYGVVRTTARGERLIDWAPHAEPMQST
jgi:hypothetical protein